MKFLKGLVLSLLGTLLFFSLSIFGFALTLNNTILNPDFVVSELDRLDLSSLTTELRISEKVSPLATELLSEQIPPQLQGVIEAVLGEEFIAEVLDNTLDNTIADLEPWIKEQMSAAVYSGYDYLMGRSQDLSLVIPTEPVIESLRDNLGEAVLQSLPPELKGLSPAIIEPLVDVFFGQLSEKVPPTIDVSERLLSPEVLAQLEQVREGIGYFQLGYKALIGFILLLILGIILINHQVRGATRGLGTTFLTYGALNYAAVFVGKHFDVTQFFDVTQLPLPEIPPSLQTWLSQLVGDFLAPLEIFSLGLLAGGVALIIVSFVYKPR